MSYGPVALDKAYADVVNSQIVLQGSYLDEQRHKHNNDFNNHFKNTHRETYWKVCIDYAVKLGLESKKYKLIEV
ncbi:hypothetical protein H8S10_05090 [Clostridium sp. NSJ-49]|uniref:hypothetical protein n=1 Tax=Clostridium TaxID=1485 RepID=UPI00164AF070|nr:MULTISPECIES: hypothetical protein [unclassified Clostridium]MBC5624829.1 hypothetical protein [Clostridium sp. NSJ-49]MCD2502448.1 hypothetical protein [Clostridium sp. NSJ-145]MDU6341701.1 hypothetical protein [Clostridium sp.]